MAIVYRTGTSGSWQRQKNIEYSSKWKFFGSTKTIIACGKIKSFINCIAEGPHYQRLSDENVELQPARHLGNNRWWFYRGNIAFLMAVSKHRHQTSSGVENYTRFAYFADMLPAFFWRQIKTTRYKT